MSNRISFFSYRKLKFVSPEKKEEVYASVRQLILDELKKNPSTSPKITRLVAEKPKKPVSRFSHLEDSDSENDEIAAEDFTDKANQEFENYLSMKIASQGAN